MNWFKQEKASSIAVLLGILFVFGIMIFGESNELLVSCTLWVALVLILLAIAIKIGLECVKNTQLRKTCRIVAPIITLVLLIGASSIFVDATTDDGALNSNLTCIESTANDNVNWTFSTSNISATATATSKTGNCGTEYTAQTGTIRLSNNSTTTDYKFIIRSKPTLNGGGSYKINGTNGAELGYPYEVTLFRGGASSIEISVTSLKDNGQTSLSLGYELVELKSSYNTTIEFDDSLGSVTVAGSSAANGSMHEIPIAGTDLVATPNDGVQFLAWINSKHQIVSGDPSFTYSPTDEDALQAVFVNSQSAAWFNVESAYLTDDLNEACGLGTKVVLVNSGVLAAGDYTIPSGVTLLIPYDTNGTVITNNMGSHLLETSDAKTEFRRLTMANGARIVLANGDSKNAPGGILCVGSQTYKQMTGQAGPYGAIYMNEGSSITVGNYAFLYAWGYIFPGDGDASGTIDVQSAGTVYENLSVMDYPGSASSTSDRYSDGIFPVRAYAVYNVEVPMTFNAGAKEYLFYSLWGSNFLVGYKNGYASFISGSDGDALFQLDSGATLTKRYASGKHYFTFNGSTSINNMTVNVNVNVQTSSTSGLPLPSGYNVVVDSGTLTLYENVIMTEGTKLTIAEGATVNTNGKYVYVFDADDDPGALTNTTTVDVHGYNFTRVQEDAVIDVNGTLIAAGNFYTSEKGASIISSGGTGVVIVSGSSDKTEVKFKTSTNTTTTYSKLTPAKLQHGNGSYLETANGEARTYQYNSATGRWECAPIKNEDGTETPQHNFSITGETHAPTCTEEGYTEQICSICGAKQRTDVKAKLEHKYDGVVTAPTCTEKGYTTYTCTYGCGDSYVDDEIAALGHTPGDAATCTTAQTCTVCGDEVVGALGHTPGAAATCTTAQTCTVCTAELTAALGHNKVSHTAQAPTCDAVGWDAYETCSRCSYSTYVEKAKLGHDPISHEAQAPTCTEIGWDAYVTCSRCDYTTYVEKTALGHDEVSHAAKAPTCTEIGWDAYVTCSRCDYSTYAEKAELGHTEVTDAAKAPTCTETGLTEGSHCSVCGEVLVKQEVVTALGHTEVTDAAKAPTCTATGLTEGSHCSVCGEVFVAQEVIPALGHKEETVSGKAATCTETGLTEGKKCSVCGEILLAQAEISAKGHSEEVISGKTATCTETGLTEGKKCSVCGVTTVAQQEISALGHKEETVAGKAATCTETGLTEGKKCSVCGVTTVAQQEISALGHKEETVAGKAATCTETGLTEGKKCSVCGVTTVAQQEISALGHKEEIVAGKAATCTETGLTEGKKCSVCGVTTVAQQEISATGHNWSDWDVEKGKEATEDKEGEQHRECQNCGESQTASIPMLSHDCSKWDQTDLEAVAPTCTEPGLTKGAKCSKCGTTLVEQQVVPATGHTEETVAGKAATCTATGLTEGKKCTVCGVTTVAQQEISALGHKEETVAGKAATCTETGLTEGKKCSVCGITTVAQQEISALGHDEETVPGKAATCTETGLTEGKKCSVCGETLTAQEIITALGHTEEAVIGKAATCTATGLTEGKKCSVCGETLVAQEVIPVLGHTEETVAGKAATCTATGLTEGKKCSVCGETLTAQEVIPMLGHTEETVAGKAATCTETGLTDGKKCSVCGETLLAQIEIPSKGHSEEVVPGKPATCTETGLTEGKKCSVCGVTTVAQEEIPALGHTEAILAGKDATCTETGLTEGKYCSVCKTTIIAQETVNALGHKAVTDEAVAPTCTETGLTEGSHCSVCNEVLVKQTVTKALGHDYDYANATYEWDVKAVKDATCTATAQCTRCDTVVTASGSVSAVTTYKPATCTEPGDVQFNADFDENAGWEDQTEYVVKGILPALGHYWNDPVYNFAEDGSSCTATRSCKHTGCTEKETATATITSEQTAPTCTEAGKMTYTATFTEEWAKVQTKEVVIEKLGHDYKSVVTAPTCTAGGYTTYTCQREGCKDSYVDDPTEARGHEYAEVVTAPTCTKAGYTTYTCQYTDCNHSYTVDGDDAKGHTAVTDAAVAPTCTEKGKTEGSHCSVCEEVLTAQTDVDALGHKNGEAVVENNVAPDCVTEGSYDSVVYCTVCEAEVSRETKTVEALGHKAGEAVKENYVKPTCTKDGSYENATYCTVCGAETSRKTVTVEKLGHTEVVDAAVAATCKANGLTEGKHCSVCNEVLVAQTETAIDSDNHEGTLVWVSVDADYHSQKYSCCGTVTVEQEGHNWGADNTCTVCKDGCDHEYESVVTEPTCTDKGYTTYTCSHCGHDYQGNETAALGHTEVVDEAVAATCTATGLTEGKHCSVCKEVLTAQTEVPAKGHTEVIDKAVAPTCTATGLTEGKHCSVCSEVLTAQTVVAAKGHTEVIDAAVSATCTETGLTEGKHCSVCSEVLTAQTVVAAKGHTEVVDEAVAATCTETGLTEGKHCSVCSEVLVAQTPIDAKGHTEETIAGKAETCTETGLTEGKKCTVCGVATVTQQIIPAKGHDYNYVVTTEATCSTPGEETGTCTRCSDKTTKVIPATNKHDYSVIVCDKEYQWKKCAMCDATNYKAPRTFRIVFQGGTGGDDIVLPGVYFYGYNETFIVPEFVSNFFKYEYSWAVDGQKLEPGKTMHVSDLASLIKTDPTVDNWNTIYVEGGYQVSGLDPNAIQMSMQYQNNSDVQNNEIFLTLSIFIRVEPGMTHNVVQSGGTEHTTLNIDGDQVGNLGLYHYQIPLTAEQMNDKSLTIEISYTENGRHVLSKVIGVNLMAYSDALNAMLGPDVTGQASQQLIAATMAYGAAIQTMDKKDAEGNIVPGDIEILNKYNELWKTEAAAVKVLDTIATAPEYSGEADYLTDAEGDGVLDADGNPIPIAKITGANVAMSRTYALLYRYEVNLPEGVEPTDFRLILTDDEQALDRTKPWDKKTGTSYTEITQVPDTTADSTPIVYDVFAIENVPASEMAVRYATLYIEYVDENGTECHAYSRTVKYGVVTYLNGQIDKMLSTPGFVIDNASDSELKELYLWSNLRTVAMLAEQKTNN